MNTRLLPVWALVGFCCIGPAQPEPIDEGYTRKIREATTETFFLTDLVDYLPASATVPTPEKVLGHIAGAPGVLTYSQDCARYLYELEKASPRVRVLKMGVSEGGKEMVVAVISDEANLARLPRLKEVNALLGDPRRLKNDAEADALIAEGLPMYWATGGMHSPETGPPEMILELAYRLAVSEHPLIRTIRKNSVVMLTPVLDVDGRDRYVDTYRFRKANPKRQPIPLVYWGQYVAHDNNRDAIPLALQLSKAIMRTWFEFKPTVFHDLHESVPYLYISTGTGPYNAWLDPITINEWQILAYNEIQEMTMRGVPGVWTHDFYDGWAPHYAFYCANGHNAIGRFYETFGAGPDTGIRNAGSTSRAWFRPNPPFPRVRWSIRNNTNIMQSALLLGMFKVANEREYFLRNYYLKSKRSVAKARTEGPAAYVFPANQPRKGNLASLLRLLQAQGVEICKLVRSVKTDDGDFAADSFVVRMDQPYSRMADMLLDSQYYSPADPESYDDCGWQLGPQFQVEVVRCKDARLLDAAMTEPLVTIETASNDGAEGVVAMLPMPADISLVQLRVACPDVEMRMAESSFKVDDKEYPAGTVLIRVPNAEKQAQVREAALRLNAHLVWTQVELTTPGRPLTVPRIAVIHTWTSTQDEGWYRLALDQLGVPYQYRSVHTLRDTPNLRESFDVIILPQTRGTAQSIVNGLPMEGEPIPWKASAEYPNLGGPDDTDDIRGGIELRGMVNLQKFVQKGGLLICTGNMVRVPIDYGLVSGVTIYSPTELRAPGGVYRAEVSAKEHPAVVGMGDEIGLYFNMYSGPILNLGGGGFGGRRRGGGAAGGGRASGRGSLTDPDVVQGRPPYAPRPMDGDTAQDMPTPSGPRPRVLLRFAPADKLLISGMLTGGEELAGKPALVECPVGQGRVLLFGFNPMWRCQTVGTYSIVLNSVLTFGNLDPLGATKPKPNVEPPAR